MRVLTLSVAVAVLSLLFTSSAKAVILVQDNFEYADQAAFDAAWPATASSSSGTLTTAQAFSGAKSIMYPSSGTLAGFRNAKTFAETTANIAANRQIEFSIRFYDSNGTAAAYREYAELVNGAGSGTADIVALGLNNNIASASYMARMTSVDGGSGSSAFFKLDGAGVPTRSTGWHQLKAVVAQTSVDFYVDGVFSKTVALPAAGQGKSYETARLGSNLSSTQFAGFDDILMQTIPEPASLSVLAAFGLLGIRRRKA